MSTTATTVAANRRFIRRAVARDASGRSRWRVGSLTPRMLRRSRVKRQRTHRPPARPRGARGVRRAPAAAIVATRGDVMTRREFLQLAAAATIAGCGTDRSGEAGGATDTGVARRRLGRTGELVSIAGLGGYHMGIRDLSEDEAIRIVRTAIDG